MRHADQISSGRFIPHAPLPTLAATASLGSFAAITGYGEASTAGPRLLQHRDESRKRAAASLRSVWQLALPGAERTGLTGIFCHMRSHPVAIDPLCRMPN